MSDKKEEVPPCCPPGSIGVRPAGPHTPKGTYEKAGDLDVYISGTAKDGRGVLIVQEVFGIKMGNLAQICDWFAEEGFFAIMVDWHRGETLKDFSKFKEFLDLAPFSKIEADFNKHIVPVLKHHKVTKLAGIGFCFGSYVCTKLSGAGHLKAYSACHPSHTKIGPAFGEDIKALAEAVKCPVVQYAAGNDGPEVKPGGSDEAIIKKKFPDSIFKEFAKMEHGWVARGDWVKKDDVWADASEAITSSIEFFKKHM